MEPHAVVEMHGITKRFGAFTANDQAGLTLYAGEVHALLGENGAGKSTLMNILCGLYQADEGEISLFGQRIAIQSPSHALAAGVAMVHQHFRLVPSLTVAENVVLGMEPGAFLSSRSLNTYVAKLAQEYGIAVEPAARITHLSMGERQRVEILKALVRNAKILILDEPTAVLTPLEVDQLLKALRNLVSKGVAVLIVTHKLKEVMAAADRITVLRGGRQVASFPAGNTSLEELAHLMVGTGEVASTVLELELHPEEAATVKGGARFGDVMLDLQGVNAISAGGAQLSEISLRVRAGEIFGIAGVSGNGQQQLAEVVTGALRATRGELRIAGRAMTNRGIRALCAAGVSYIPEDRIGTGMVGSLSICDNAILKSSRSPAMGRHGFLNYRKVRQYAEELVRQFDVRSAGLDTPVRNLSGGNIQKLLIAREVAVGPKVLVAVHPTHGLDVGATAAVHKHLQAQAAAGVAILLISEDLDEVLALSDRLAVIYGGRIMGVQERHQFAVPQVGLMMAGMPMARGDSLEIG